MNYFLLFILLLAIVLVFSPKRSKVKKKTEVAKTIKVDKKIEKPSKVEVHG
jgi:hypothetical protein